MLRLKALHCGWRAAAHPGELVSLAAGIGPPVRLVSLADALAADIVFLAFPFTQHRQVTEIGTWQGKTVVDVTNAFGVPAEELDGLPSSAWVARDPADARLVKGFKHLGARMVGADPAVNGTVVQAWGKDWAPLIFQNLVKVPS